MRRMRQVGSCALGYQIWIDRLHWLVLRFRGSVLCEPPNRPTMHTIVPEADTGIVVSRSSLLRYDLAEIIQIRACPFCREGIELFAERIKMIEEKLFFIDSFYRANM